MDLRDYLRIFRRQLVLIIAATVIGVSCGALVAMLTPQRFDATTDVMVTVQVKDGATPVERSQATSYAQQVVETYRTLITSSLVLDQVIDDLGLSVSPAQLASRVDASTSPRSTIITIRVSDANPGQSARIANAIADSFAESVTETLEAREQATAYEIRIVTLEQAQVPIEPAAPNLRLSLLIGTVLGLGAGIGIALLRSLLDQRVRTVADVESAVDVPVLGTITYDADAGTRPLIVATEPQNPRSEAFRSLRTNVRFLFPAGAPGVFVVTSSGPGEGKSTTAANLAIAFAESGYRVALVDGDLRLPRVADYFGMEGSVGLTDVLIGRVAITDVIHRWGRGTLFVLPSGRIPPNPAELLGSPAMESLVETLEAAFDVVIIDAPPLPIVTDAAVMARFATGALLVAAAGSTARNRLVDAAKSIEAVGARVLGTVVTMVPTSGADKTAYGNYSYAVAE